MVTDSGPRPPTPGGPQPEEEGSPAPPRGRAAGEPSGSPPGEPAEGGETACWAHLVCPECGAMTAEGHRPSCAFGRRDSG